MKSVNLPKVNYIQDVIKSDKVLKVNTVDTLEVLPRAEPKMLRGLKRVKTPWDFMNSVFAKYKPDNEKILNECFFTDWGQCRFEKVFRNDQQQIELCKDYLFRNYKYIRDVYKHFSSEATQGKMPCIGRTEFNNIFSLLPGFVDGETLKSADVDLVFVAANSIKGPFLSLQYFPEKLLIRFKFFEAVIRLCMDKYFKTKLVKTPIEALKLGFEEHFKPNWAQYCNHRIRRERIWREENDITLKRLMKIIEALYANNSGKYSVSKRDTFMCLEEFCGLIE